MVNELVENDQYVHDLRRSLHEGIGSIEDAPGTLRIVLERGMWRRRFDRITQQEVGFDSFAEFVTTRPTEGLGTTVAMVRRIVADDPMVLDLLDQAEQRPPALHNVQGTDIEAPTGNAPEAALRRLRKDRPDLHARVLSRELSPHAAMVEAGFRRRTLTVPVSVDGFARAITRHLDSLERAALLRMLQEGMDADDLGAP